jgi:WD40 repeat protein
LDGLIHVWNASDGHEVASLRGHKGFVYGVRFSPNGLLASAAWDRTVKLWDVAAGRELATLRGHEMLVLDVAFRPDGRRLASACMDQTVKLWDVDPPPDVSGAVDSSPRAEETQAYVTLRGHSAPVEAVAFSPDDDRLATGDWDGVIWVWDTTAHRPVLAFRGHSTAISSVEFGPDGRQVVSASGGKLGLGTGEVKVWDARTGREAATMHAGVGPVCQARFSPDGTKVVSCVGTISRSVPGEIKLWDAATGRELARVPGDSRKLDVVFTHDGRYIASVGFEPGVRVWDAETGKPARDPYGPDTRFRAIVFSRDGKLLAAAALDTTIRVFETATGREVWKFPGHNMGSYGLAFDPGGRRLTSCGADASVKVWDLESGLELLTLRHHDHEVYGVAFDHEGRTLVTCGFDGAVKLLSSRNPPLPRTNEWPVLFADDFERAELGGRWEVNAGQWSVEKGALRGVLQSVQGDVERATIIPRGLSLPAHVEVRFDCWTPDAIVAEAKLVDEPSRQGLLALLADHPQFSLNWGVRGAVLMSRAGAYTPVAANTVFAFQPGTRYHVRVVREPRRLALLVDEVVVLSAPVPALDVPALHLQGSWGKAGSVIYFDNVEVRGRPAG